MTRNSWDDYGTDIPCNVAGCVLAEHEGAHQFDIRLRHEKTLRRQFLTDAADRYDAAAKLLRDIAAEMMGDDK